MKKRYFLELLNIFSMVTTFVMIAVAMFTTVFFPADAITPAVLWQIPAVSLLCTLGSLIYPDRSMGRTERWIRILVHYLYINAIVLVAGVFFEWYHVSNPQSVFFMVFTVTIVFAIVSVLSWNKASKDAKRMNEKLQEYQQEKH